jgi:cell division protein FtsB
MRYERCVNTSKDIVELPWVLLSCGFWMVLAFIRGQKIRYQQWRMRRLEAQTRRLEAQTRRLEAERDRYERRARDLEKRMAGDE